MSRFDRIRQHKSAIDWSVIAYKTADEDKAAQTVVLGLAVGVALCSVSPLLGGVAGSYFAIKGIQKAIASDKNKKYIKNAGCVAHVLEGGDFRAYLHQVGESVVLDELDFAEQEGLSFSNEAIDFYEECQDRPELQTPVLPRSSEPSPHKTAIRASTTVLQTQVDHYDPTATVKVDIIGEMTNRISNTIIVGIPGSGKGMLISNAIREAKHKHPNLKIFVIDPKADPKELKYYSNCCDVYKLYPCMDAKPATVAVWAEAAFDEYAIFATKHERTLLIVDEGTMLGNKLQQAKSTLLVDKLTSYTSGGDSAGRNVWFLMQSPYVGGASLNLSTTSQMTSIVIAFSENIGAIAQWKSAKIFKQLSLDEVSSLIEQSETGRAIYYGKTGKWYMMPALKNYSGYDRDNRFFLPGGKPQTTEKVTDDIDTVFNLESKLKNSAEQEEEEQEEDIQDTTLTEHEQMLYSWIKTRKATGKEYDINTANKNLDKLAKPNHYDSKAEYLRCLARQLVSKKKGTLINPNLFEPK